MNEQKQSSFAAPFSWPPLVAAVAVLVITQIPFWFGFRWAPQGTVFDGLTGLVHDQNMYFSYIRQAAEGEWLFRNRLTHLEHDPALFNIEWLAVGRLMGWLGGTDSAADIAFAVWRVLGGCVLIGGFWWLANVLLRNEFQRRTALWLCAFGGGFGWIFQILQYAGLIKPIEIASHDISGSVHPFSHILFAPHISCSHGMTLLFLAAFVRGEQTGRPRWYVMAALLAAFHGLFRPYDLIMISGAIPLFIVTERVITGQWSWRATALRIIPLAVIAPVVAYYALLFEFHPVFKHWAHQGIIPHFNVFWHFFSLGWAGLFFLLRLALVRRFPLNTSGERLVLVWIVAVLLLFHGHRLPFFSFMPYTPVFGATLPSAMLALGLAVLNSDWSGLSWPAWRRQGLFVAFAIVTSASSTVWFAKICRNLAYLPEHYIPAAQHDAYGWLNQHAAHSDVVFSTLFSGNRMAKYVSARFVLGHKAVTPNRPAIEQRVETFYRGKLSSAEAAAMLTEFQTRWIWLSPIEQELGTVSLEQIPGVTRRYAKPGIEIYSYDLPAAAP